MKLIRVFSSVLLLSLSLAACGTTSSMQSANISEQQRPSLAGYDVVVIEDFKIASEATGERVGIAGKSFADSIANAVKGKGGFKDVQREEVVKESTAEKAVVISGTITDYKEGNAALRMFVGMGAGSSVLDADVNFADSSSKETLGSIKVDKNSWALGGGIAATQTVETLMHDAAEKIAAELYASKFPDAEPKKQISSLQ